MKKILVLFKICACLLCLSGLFGLLLLPVCACDGKIYGYDAPCGFNERNITTYALYKAKNQEKFATSEENTDDIKELITTPKEYENFVEALPEGIADSLPEGVFSEKGEEVSEAAMQLGSLTKLLGAFLDAFGSSLTSVLPTLAMLFGIVLISALSTSIGSSAAGGLGGTVSFAARLCSFSVISACSVAVLDSLKGYFDSLFATVTAFVPLSGVLLAMGGNLTGAAGTSMTLTLTLSVCQAICANTVIPVFCICLSLTLITLFEGQSATVGQTASASVKKWYTTILGFIMMIMTVSALSQSIISSRADSAAMRGAKFAASSFIPISGGALSSTLGTLCASVELLRGSIGVIGIAVIMLMLIPTVVELALLRGVFSLVGFVAGMLGCSGEQRLLGEIGSLYGFLEGVAALSSAIFIISFAVFAATASAIG